MKPKNLLYVFVGLILGVIGSTQLPLQAQKPPRETVVPGVPREVDSQPAPAVPTASGKVSLQDALHQPYIFAFGKATPLSEVARRLTADLGGQVVLDLAALDRLELRTDDAVELELKGARLKTGLKLLLDQVELTYRLIPEDNLLILTDDEGAEEPLDKVWSELNHLHRDIHDVQLMVEYLYDRSVADAEMAPDAEPRLEQPTIVEEMPEAPGGAVVPPGPNAAPKAGPKPDPKDDHHRTPPKRPRTRL
jgi:hypothetical protein